MNPKLLPTIMIVLQVGSAIGYLGNLANDDLLACCCGNYYYRYILRKEKIND